ncbi:hypothetical protein B0T19DRAFT_403027 [Cercophora scortea]|uniref:Uncharacterized protein n=1 Tax=Cercophora scortea TaxID=314031 RepID=A0AAE0IGQ9_9PEZI|nr:hypothetical protein B0T19DRAFT_403027 [Cercophora scortea]
MESPRSTRIFIGPRTIASSSSIPHSKTAKLRKKVDPARATGPVISKHHGASPGGFFETWPGSPWESYQKVYTWHDLGGEVLLAVKISPEKRVNIKVFPERQAEQSLFWFRQIQNSSWTAPEWNKVLEELTREDLTLPRPWRHSAELARRGLAGSVIEGPEAVQAVSKDFRKFMINTFPAQVLEALIPDAPTNDFLWLQGRAKLGKLLLVTIRLSLKWTKVVDEVDPDHEIDFLIAQQIALFPDYARTQLRVFLDKYKLDKIPEFISDNILVPENGPYIRRLVKTLTRKYGTYTSEAPMFHNLIREWFEVFDPSVKEVNIEIGYESDDNYKDLEWIKP